MFRATLLGSSIKTCLGSSSEACSANLAQNMGMLADAVSQVEISHLKEPLSFPYRYIEDPLHTDQDGRLFDCALALAQEALSSSNLDKAALRNMGLFVGSSSFNVGENEARLKDRSIGEPTIVLENVGQGKLSQRLKRILDLGGTDFTYSTACTSSANALLSAHQMLSQGAVDHALVIGLELFNETTLLGFYNLGLLAKEVLLPFDDKRDGLILGEAGAAVVLSREADRESLLLCGGAIRTDTGSITSVCSDGSTVAEVMQAALSCVQVDSRDISAIKAHGTGSPMSDEAEAHGLHRVFEKLPPIIALKPAIGHTLGASGAVEFALWSHCIAGAALPANTGIAAAKTLSGVSLNQDPTLPASGYHLLNYFAFGGNNTVLVTYRD